MHLALGNQLFAPQLIPNIKGLQVLMIEDMGLCTYVRHHKLKIQFFLAAMRHYASELEAAGAKVHYLKLDPKDDRTYEEKLGGELKRLKARKLQLFEVEDKFFEARLSRFLEDQGVEVTVLPSPMFLTGREQFSGYLKKSKKPFMKTFYEQQRRSTGILMTKSGVPEGGKFSFDTENRKKLPSSAKVPTLPKVVASKENLEVRKLVEAVFPDHPGSGDALWLPTTREGAESWLQEFLKSRMEDFGEYEDAMTERSDVVFHSVLTPFLNVGLLTPEQVLKELLKAHQKKRFPLNSTEGFIRQILGWREFIRGIYQNFNEKQESTNFWGHHRKMKSCWYDGTTGLPPVDAAIRKALRLGYNHHIERLMVLANVMNLSEIEPTEVHRWFMEMYIDSSDWVMGPNVYGMGLFSDGGIFATKPYICGSNYILKMSDFKKGDWCDELDGLYWQFIDKHQDFYGKNPRMSVMVAAIRKMPAEKKERLFKAAESFRKRTTTAGP